MQFLKNFRHPVKFLDTLESLWAPWKISRHYDIVTDTYGMFPDNLKVSNKTKKNLGILERFQIIWIVSRHAGNFRSTLESFWVLKKNSDHSGNFLDHLKHFRDTLENFEH